MLQAEQGGANQPVRVGELAFRIAAHPGAGIFKRPVLEAGKQILEMADQKLHRHLVGLRQSQRALQHGVLDDILDAGILNGLIDVFPVGIKPQIGADRMAHIVHIQLSSDVIVKGLIGHHILDFRNFAAEGCLVHRKETVPLHADAQRIPGLHFLCLNRNHPSDGGLHQPDILIQPGRLFFCKLCLQKLFQNPVGVHQVLADNNVQRAALPRPSPADSLRQIWHDKFQHIDAHGGGHDVCLRNRLRGRFPVIPVYRPDMLHLDILMALVGHNPHRIPPIPVQSVDDRLRHIDKGYLIARHGKQHSDKAPADIAAAIHDCFHFFPILLSRPLFQAARWPAAGSLHQPQYPYNSASFRTSAAGRIPSVAPASDSEAAAAQVPRRTLSARPQPFSAP